METADLDKHCTDVLTRMARGSVVPFLGAGVNLCGRPPGADWSKDTYLPDGGELAEHFAERYGYPGPDRHDLGRVSQFIDLQLREMARSTRICARSSRAHTGQRSCTGSWRSCRGRCASAVNRCRSS